MSDSTISALDDFLIVAGRIKRHVDKYGPAAFEALTALDKERLATFDEIMRLRIKYENGAGYR